MSILKPAPQPNVLALLADGRKILSTVGKSHGADMLIVARNDILKRVV